MVKHLLSVALLAGACTVAEPTPPVAYQATREVMRCPPELAARMPAEVTRCTVTIAATTAPIPEPPAGFVRSAGGWGDRSTPFAGAGSEATPSGPSAPGLGSGSGSGGARGGIGSVGESIGGAVGETLGGGLGREAGGRADGDNDDNDGKGGQGRGQNR